MKQNGDIVKFIREKDYVMVDNSLGHGAFGRAALLQDPYIDELFVAKKHEPEFPEDKKRFYKNFLQEIKILYKLNHPNIVRIFNYYAYEQYYTGYILMEYIPGKTINDYFYDYLLDVTINVDDIFRQLISGFQYIEANGICHRDIREGNIMVDNQGIVKIIDFGLGKIFKPVEKTTDSLTNEINRSGLDALPNEYFEGTYTSQTDMFYLAELYQRLLKLYSLNDIFSYNAILKKMMSVDKENRYATFTEISEAIGKKDFPKLEFSKSDKLIYQNFTNAIMRVLIDFIDEVKLISDVPTFQSNLSKLIEKNCFEDEIQYNADLVRTLVASPFHFDSSCSVSLDTVEDFNNWFLALLPTSKNLVITNILAKLGHVKQVPSIEDIPF